MSAFAAQAIPVVAPPRSVLDLSAPESASALADLLRPDDTLLFASAIAPDKGRDASTFMRNVAMGHHVAAAVRRGPCRQVVYLSSVAVYGATGDTPASERARCDPDDLYGMMHLAREMLLRTELGPARVPVAILRLSSVYGAGDTHDSYGPNRFVRELEQAGRLTLFGDGAERRDHVCLDDVVAVILAVIRRRSEDVLNVVSGRSVSFAAVAEILDRINGARVPRETRERSAPLTHRHYDATRLHASFPGIDWTPVDEGLARLVAARVALRM